MSPNSLNSTPITPFPDPPSHSGEEPEPVTGLPDDFPAPRDVTKPSTSSADDLSLLLAQSDPDPYLAEDEGTSDPADPGKPLDDIEGGEPVSSLHLLSSPENGLDIACSPAPGTQPSSHQPAASSPEPAGEMQNEAAAPRISWPLLLVSSYASALTLALGFILWTGRGLSRLDFSPSSEPVPGSTGPSPGRGASGTGEDLLPLPAPIDPAIVRDPVPAVDQSFIEVPGGRRIAMFRLALESEWSIREQVFRSLKPGETVETVLVSEPVAMADLKGTMTWHVKLRTAPFRTDVLGVRFVAEQVANESE